MKKNEILTIAIKALWEDTLKNKKLGKKRGAPVTAVIFNAKTGEVLTAHTNDKADTKARDPKTHAEKKCLKDYSSSPYDELHMMITLNPCSSCLWAIKRDNTIKNIHYLIDTDGGKIDPDGKVWITKMSGKTKDQKHIIEKIEKNFEKFRTHKRKNPTNSAGEYLN